MAKRIIIAIASLLTVMVIIYGIFGIRVALAIKKFSHVKQETFVADEAAKQETWQPTLAAVGNLAPVEGIQLSNQLAGTVTGIYFQSGQEVKQGQLLLKLDDSAERAQLMGFQAQQKLAELTFQRTQQLLAKHLVSQADLDTAQSNLKAAQANVANTQSAIAKKNITAPFAGRTGIRNVNLGQYLAVGTNIVSLQSLDTLYVSFALPEQDLAVLAPRQRVAVSVDAYPGKTFDGEINAIDSSVDPDSHNVMVQATIRNTGHLLRAGMFANVAVSAGKPMQVVSVPKTAVDYSLYGSSVFIVKPEGKDTDGTPVLKVNQVFVTTGQQRGDQVAILKGVAPGDMVVTAGQQKLQNGMQVEINNSVSTN